MRRGDQEAFAQLYDRYSAALYGVILKVVRDEKRAEETLQDAFLKIWRSIGSYDPAKGRPFTWMLNIARNAAIDVVRTAEFRMSGSIQGLDGHVYRTGSDEARQELEHIGVDRVLAAMPPEHREIIDMAYYQGFTQQEIAERTGIPLGTVKSRTRAALSHLRTALKDHR
ncbi:MAG TPA: sigma-70 family RNA polymerase sigma factor [Flavobacteriales bacterium]|nr:sigma-70 family RNA polymerase sigma factor [Flavobacteriales bacterium]